MKEIKKNKYFILLIAMFAIALFLRFYNLSMFPVGFHIDEASLGYNGYSILKTARDDNGNFLPLYVDMFGDNRPSGYHFLTVAPIILFGLNEFSTRLPAAIFGSLSVFAMYFFVSKLFKNKTVSLISAGLITISPWHIVLSRASGEAIVALFFILFGFGCIFLSIEKQKKIILGLGMFISSISFFFYHTPRVFVPLILLGILVLLIIQKVQLTKEYKITYLISFSAIILFLAILVLGISGGSGRFNQVNIFSAFETNFQLQMQSTEDHIGGGNRVISKFFHNKFTNLGVIFSSNYLEYFSGAFLFIKGGLPIWYSIPRMGLLYLVELPLILFGIYFLIKGKHTSYKIPFVWILFAPIVAGITNDDVPNINRASVLFPMLHILTAFGIIYLLEKYNNKKRILIVFILAVFLVSLGYFLQQYFVNARAHNPWYRNNGFSQMMEIVNKNYNKYDKIIISKYQGGIYPLVLFYSKFDPKSYQDEGSPKDRDYKGFGKFVFAPQDCPSVQHNKLLMTGESALFIDRGDCPYDKTLAVRKHSFVLREDTTKAFRIVYE